MNINEVINSMNSNQIDSVQLSKRIGILSSTWLLYNKDGFYYYFDINQKIEFIDMYKYTLEELIEELKFSVFNIELTIN